MGGDGLGGEVAGQCPDLVDAGDVPFEVAEPGESLVEEHVDDGEEQRGVGAGARGDVEVGELGGAGALGVEDGESAAAAAQRLELAGEVGGGGEAAVGHQGVAADDDQVVGAVQVGHGDGERVAVEVAARRLLGHLVQGAGREQRAGAECADDHRRVEAARDGVHVGVAQVDAGRRGAVGRADAGRAVGDGGVRLGPGRLGEHAVAAHERAGEPVGVPVDLAEGGALGADEPRAEDVVAVAAGAGDPVRVDGQGQSARGLAQRTDTQGGTTAGHRASRGRALPRVRPPYRPVCMSG